MERILFEREKIVSAIMQTEVHDISDTAEVVVSAVERFPAGHVNIKARHKQSDYESTVFDVWWYAYKKEKYIMYSSYLRSEFCDPVCSISVSKSARERAYKIIFPERYKQLKHLINVRRLRRLNLDASNCLISEIDDVNERFRLALASVSLNGRLPVMALITPMGLFHVNIRAWIKSERKVSFAVKKITGQSLPKSRKATWEDIEPLFAMAALAK